MHLPDHSSDDARGYIQLFFINKICIIRSSFCPGSCSNVLNPPDTREVLRNLTWVTDHEVRCLVLFTPCKSPDIEPLYTSLEKDCIDIVAILITSLVNIWLSEGSLPSHFKSPESLPMLHRNTNNYCLIDYYLMFLNQSINQSINQTSTAPISPAKPGSVAWQPKQCSTAKSRKQFRNISRPWRVTVSMGERPNQRDVSSDISWR